MLTKDQTNKIIDVLNKIDIDHTVVLSKIDGESNKDEFIDMVKKHVPECEINCVESIVLKSGKFNIYDLTNLEGVENE